MLAPVKTMVPTSCPRVVLLLLRVNVEPVTVTPLLPEVSAVVVVVLSAVVVWFCAKAPVSSSVQTHRHCARKHAAGRG